ncbi:MAG: acyl-CoA dehydrogenase [Desulfobacterales bacterium]|nr:acyl-CoA dehydrogenase [Desulfobacterales bacterium]
MNFDFTQDQQNVFKELSIKSKSLVDAQDNSQQLVNLKDALTQFAPMGYLQTGLQNEESLTLMGSMEQIASNSPSLCLSIEMSTRIFGKLIQLWENKEQQKSILSQLINGSLVGAVASSEESMNIDSAFQTQGTRDGNQVIINGTKHFVINAKQADWIAVLGTLEGKTAVFMVPQGCTGLIIEDRLATLGFEDTWISNSVLKNCTIPETHVIGPFTQKQEITDKLLLWQNQLLIGICLGLMKASYETANSFSKVHKSGGKPIAAYQEVSFKLAEMLTLYQTSQLLAYRSAWTVDQHEKEGDVLTQCAKVFCSESAEKVAGSALQILSQKGYISGNPAEQAYRCAKFCQIAGTSTEIARVKIGDAELK